MFYNPTLAYHKRCEKTNNNIYFLRFDSLLNCFIISCYKLTQDNEDLIFFSVDKKYYFEDTALDTLLINQNKTNYDFDQFKCNYTLLNNKLVELIGVEGSVEKTESMFDIYPDLYKHVVLNGWFYNEDVILLELNANLTNEMIHVRKYTDISNKDFAIYFTYTRIFDYSE